MLTDYLKNKAVLITGATGMIGQELVRRLIEENTKKNLKIQILAHARSMEKAEKVFSEDIQKGNITLIISDIAELTVDTPVDYIVHTAGVTGGSKQHIDFPMRTISVAIDGTRRILNLAREKKSKGVVYLSSLEVYGNPGLDREIAETEGGYIDPMNVRSSYSESKRLCECMCAAYAKQYGVPVVSARLTATFGPGVSYQDMRVFAQFARCIIEKKDIVLKSTGETVRNYCDVSDACEAILLLLCKGKSGEAYNIANKETEISIKEMAETFIRLFAQQDIKLVFDLSEDATKLGYQATMKNVLCPDKLMKLGWEPKYSLEDTIRRLVFYMEKNRS